MHLATCQWLLTMTRIKPNRGAHVLLFPTPAPGTIKIIGLCRNARAQKGVSRTEPDNFYSAFFSRSYQKKLFSHLSRSLIAYTDCSCAVVAAPPQASVRSDTKDRWTGLQRAVYRVPQIVVIALVELQPGQDCAYCKRDQRR